MKIKEFEIRNHNVLGDIHLTNFGDEINVFAGRNGSGKSLLLSILHPWPTPSASRFEYAYPIIPGKAGYKRIVFEDGKQQYETIHEYAVKGERHQCKSYFNIINGSKVEHNPTGHSEVYKDLVKKYLHFDSNTLDVSVISFDHNGLVSSSAKQRREIIFNTIDVSVLEMFQDVSQTRFREANTGLGMLETSKVKILTEYHGMEEIEADIGKLKIEIDEKMNVLTEATKELAEAEKELDELKNIDLGNINVLKNAETIFESYPQFNTVHEFMVDTNLVMEPRIVKYRVEIAEYDRKIDYAITNLRLVEKKVTLEQAVKSQEAELEEIRGVIQKAEIDENTILRDLEKLEECDPIRFEIDNLCGWEVSNFEDAQYVLQTEYRNQADLIEFCNKYERMKEIADNSQGWDCDKVTDYCDKYENCPFYGPYHEALTHVNALSDAYKTNKETLSLTNDVIKLFQKLESTYPRNMKMAPEFALEHGLDLFKSKKAVSDGVEFVKSLLNRKSVLLNEIRENKETLKTIQDVVPDAEDPDVLKDKQEALLRESREYTKEVIARRALLEQPFPTEIQNMSKELVLLELSKTKNKKKLVEEAQNRSKMAQDSVNDVKSSISSLNMQFSDLKAKSDELKELNESLVKYSKDKIVYGRMKDILNKDIPIHLLKKNLIFIEQTVNNILAENSINLSIEILTYDNDIVITVYTADNIVPDVSTCSSGEKCLISLLLNASVTHIMGYGIMCLDEIDTNLDAVNRMIFTNVIYSLLDKLKIDQILCVSHNVANNISSARKYLLGSSYGLGLSEGYEQIK